MTGLAVAETGTPAGKTGSAPTPLISRQVLFGNPDRASPRFSPDGKWISFLADVGGVMNVHVAPAEDPSAARAITRETVRGVRQYFWAFDNQHVLYLQDKGGDENWRLYSVDVQTGQERDLTPFAGVQTRIESVDPEFPSEVLIGLNNRSPRVHDIYSVNVATGDMVPVQMAADEISGFIFDNARQVRFAERIGPDGSLEYLRQKPDGSGWEPAFTIGADDARTTSVLGFAKDNESFFMLDSRGRNTSALTRVKASDLSASVLAENPKADAAGVTFNLTTKEPEAVGFNYLRNELAPLTERMTKDLAFLRTVDPGEVGIASRSLDDSVWLVSFGRDDGPVRFYRYTRGPEPRAEFLFTNRKSLEGLTLSNMTPVVIPSRDGLDLVSYLTLPAWAEASMLDGAGGVRAGHGAEPLPMVLVVHGGPWARDSWGFNPIHQLLANRGYAVLSVNFRSSTGFGKAFINAGRGEWAAKMHNDLLDAVDWAVKGGIARKDAVAIMGGSYGGYATLVGMTFTPEVFACGVSIVGPSNLMTLLESIPPYWGPIRAQFTIHMGDPATEEGRALLRDRSPLFRADKIVRPLLIGQGANDPRVKQAESDQIVAKMQELKIPVTYVLFPDEGHGFARPANNMAFWAVTEQFFAKHLGGRAEPIGEDLKKSTATIPAGGEWLGN